MRAMGFAALVSASLPPLPAPSSSPRRPPRTRTISCSSDSAPSICPPGQPEVTLSHSQNGINAVTAAERLEFHASITGGAYDFRGATTSLTNELLTSSKKVTLVRHGLSSWNADGRVQGSTDLSVLTDVGIEQAKRCQRALSNIYFDKCFFQPHITCKEQDTAEIMWSGKEQPLHFMDSLKEAHLYFLEGMTTADAKEKYPDLYHNWRFDPANFKVDGVYPIRRLWAIAQEAWREILLSPGESFLVITHKSILRALICTALGLGPERFRALDINNGGITVFMFNVKGEPMLKSLNMTAHMYSDYSYFY